MSRRKRLVGAVILLGLIVSGGAVAIPATPAVAAPGDACVTADVYGQRTVTPANAASGTPDSGAKFGSAVVTADFNKDGYADVAVGAPNDAPISNVTGSVSVFPGSANGIGSGKRLTQGDVGAGNDVGDRFGAALAVGDFNKDTYPDLAVGIPGETLGTATKAGAIAVFPGGASGLTSGKFLDQSNAGGANESNDAFGSALAAGDFNADGYADLAIGAPGEAPENEPAGGFVFVMKGSASGVVSGWFIKQEAANGATEAGDEFGAALAAGKVTGSSHADLIVGAPGEAPGSDAADSGGVYVFPGAADGVGTAFWEHQETTNGGTNEANDRMGAALAVGNFDGDGYADVAVGVPGEGPGSNPAGGSILIMPGASSGLDSGYWVQEYDGGEMLTAGDKFGAALAAGDVDRDGFADLLAGAPGKAYGSATSAGAAFLYRGRARETGSTRSLKVGRRIGQPEVNSPNESSDAFGWALAMGDVTGDGKADGVIGAPGEAAPGLPASGTVVQLSKLAPAAAAAVPVVPFTPTAAMQGTPVAGASTASLEYTYTDNIGRLLHGQQPDPTNVLNVQWTVISGAEAYTGTPAMAEQADGRLQIAGHNANGTGWTITQATKDPAAWGSWAAADGAIRSHIGMAKAADGRLVAFGVDAAGVLWAMQQNAVNGSYTSWFSLGVGGFAGTPVAVAVSGGIQVFGLDATGQLRTARYANGTLSGCTSLSDPGLTGTPAVVVYPGSIMRVFVRTADGTIMTKKQDSSGVWPAQWEALTGFTSPGSPSALISPTTGITEVVARGDDGGIYNIGETVQGSGTWRPWERKTDVGDLAAATDPTAFGYTAGANGPMWAFLYRSSDNQTRIYTLRTAFGVAALSAEGKAPPAPTFTGATLPAPPR